ncbi:type I-E CRISPR-associated protein Cse2/CasB [Carboxydochorda subterranea]|uniref:Type I-E CRISPR-associated protein Cse2/CasB n=1 Tax=Carboxydichorda subterranea TaxID=3109565 RepID=A0ABZ1BUS4_9FIRM|nr:type I-E CRISPR-associated protein Cse2/CasB [Limnochorda sp. L945t]WRP16338.1 type I-E CRISPR-associated protein Cse2/CasB [Limnochorda sp. L945t]
MVATKAEEFVRFLEGLASNRGPLAALRRSLAFHPGSFVPSYPYVEPFVRDYEGWQREAYYLVAGLFALHPFSGSKTLPEAMAELRITRKSASIEARFVALLDSDRDQLPDRLRHAVILVTRSQNMALDWVRLLTDVVEWFRPDRKIQREWARAFYRAMGTQPTPAEEAVKV